MKNIMLKIVGIKIENSENSKEKLEFVTEGKFYIKDEAKYIVYDESEISGMPGFQTKLVLRKDGVSMKRFSSENVENTEINFVKGKRYEGMYETPFGNVKMEVLTNELSDNITNEGKGFVNIDYDISLKGLTEGRTQLNIEILESEG